MSKHKSKKDKKAKGHVEAYLLMSPREAKEYNLESVKSWDDWMDYRDGYRDYRDRSKIRPTHINKWCVENYHILEDNKKLKKKEKIRRLRKQKCMMV